MTQINNKKSQHRHSFGMTKIILAIILVAGISFGIFYFFGPHMNPDQDKKGDQQSAEEDLPVSGLGSGGGEEVNKNPDDNNYSEGDKIKEEIDKEQATQKPVEEHKDGRKKANVVIGFACAVQGMPGGPYEDHLVLSANGSVTNLVESNGSCIYNFTAPDGQKYSTNSKTLPSAKDTPCEIAELDAAKPGHWKLQLIYDSPSAHGESAIFEFDVR